MEQNAQGGGRRPHYHRGRRGADRRGTDRRVPGTQAQASADTGQREHREHVDVEQIMREIRSRIAKGSGVDVTPAQIHELAARRLEAILDPRNVSPGLLDQLRKGAALPLEAPKPTAPAYSFDETTLTATESGVVRFFRRLFAPLLKVLFNIDPIVSAFRAQQVINQEAAVRDAARDRRQAEWNALHYELLQKLVTEASRATLEMQSLSLKVEALSAKVDFNDRRVRNIESSVHQSRPQARPQEPRERPERPERAERPERHDRFDRSDRQDRPERAERALDPATPAASADVSTATAPAAGTGDPSGEGNRRRRRRRRGRRSGGGAAPADPSAAPFAAAAAGAAETDADDVDVDSDEGGDEDTISESLGGSSAPPASPADGTSGEQQLLSAPPATPQQPQLPPATISPATAPVAAAPEQPAPVVEPTPPRDEAIEPQPPTPVAPAEQEPPER